MKDSKEQILKDLNEIENRLTVLDPEWRIYMLKKPIFYRKENIQQIIQHIYTTFNLPYEPLNSADVHVSTRKIVTYYLKEHRHISLCLIATSMGLHNSIGQHYYNAAKKLITENKNDRNFYESIVALYE